MKPSAKLFMKLFFVRDFPTYEDNVVKLFPSPEIWVMPLLLIAVERIIPQNLKGKEIEFV